MDKLPKALVLYVFDPPSGYTCSECAFVSTTGKCTDYAGFDEKVSPHGSCNDWRTLRNGRIEGNHDRTREATGYVENYQGFSCKRCEEFVADTRRCLKVDEKGGLTPGEINPNACCNRWEPGARRTISDSEFKHLKEYR